ncbi:hypothetical protein T492DRAFT_1151245 [Pavlovales sp. CCMP2436]|nr:hypothetical protein T492DRAFT_1151245 [Pavlovales sp. CCMP2436]
MTVGLVAVMLLAALPDFARVAVGSAPRLIVRRAPARSAPVALTVSEIVSALPGLVGLRVLSSLAPSEIAGSIARFPPAAPADVANPPLVLPDGGRRLQLSERESELFDFLKEVAAVSGCKTTMRVAGGWVRDKLLGRDCDDIDLALDNMTGLSFANAIRAALEERGELLHIGVIQANPEQARAHG